MICYISTFYCTRCKMHSIQWW